jgi:hypothetical protein
VNLSAAIAIAEEHRSGSIPLVWMNTLVKVVYSDESGTGSIKKQPLTVVTAYLVNLDRGWEALERPLLKVAQRAWRELRLPELKGSLLFKEIRRDGKHAKVAQEILASGLSLARDHLLPIFHAAVHRQNFEDGKTGMMGWLVSKSDNPFRIALRSCLENIDSYVHTNCHDDKVLWVADDASYNEHGARKELLSLQRFALWGQAKFRLAKESPRISHLVDTMYFGTSEDSLALQLADICCSTVATYLQWRWLGIRRDKVAEYYYGIIEPRIVQKEVPPLFL